jgi:hypothetical protein
MRFSYLIFQAITLIYCGFTFGQTTTELQKENNLSKERRHSIQLHTPVIMEIKKGVSNVFVDPVSQFGLQYDYSFHQSFSAGMRYTYSNPGITGFKQGKMWEGKLLEVGDIYAREVYHYFDVHTMYHYRLHHNHVISFKQALSLAVGKNDYITDVNIRNENPAAIQYYYDTEFNTDRYLGGLSMLSYDYYFSDQRLRIGIDIGCRYYSDMPFLTYNYLELHIGFNF